MKICVINNTAHDGSICLLENDKIIYFIQEERLSRIKYDTFPSKSIQELSKYTNVVDVLILTSTIDIGINEIIQIFNKYYKPVKIYNYSDQHHLSHACTAFYNSGFNDAINIVVDGAGSYNHNDDSWEETSIFYMTFPLDIDLLYQKRMSRQDQIQTVSKDGINFIDGKPGIVKMYEAVTEYLGHNAIEAGKTMGLSAYGKDNPNIPDMMINQTPNMNLFTQNYPSSSLINETCLNLEHTKEIEQDLAAKIQKTSEEVLYNTIQKAITLKSNCKNITISGGFGLNCVANYKYLKEFNNINFFIEPVANDAGTSLGIGKYIYYSENKDVNHKPQSLKTLYLGGQYNPYENSYVREYAIKTSKEEVAKLLTEGKIIGLFQGRSEAGSRALGNRSIIMDPRIENGKDIINKVKHREWYRPFAGTVLEEEAHNWFEMDRLESSPFMTYAIPTKENKVDLIKSIVHEDNTCRIQTVNIDQNYNYYKLIQEFYKLTTIPILLNTSFNTKMSEKSKSVFGTKGEPIVETVEDAINSFTDSDIDCIYFADIDVLIKTESKSCGE